jgi:hypothetical protein
MRRSRHEAALIMECARAHGVSARAVREWRAVEDPRWGAFLHNRAKQSTFQATEIPGELLSIEEEEETAARRYAALSRLADEAISRGDMATLPALLRNSEQAHTTLHKVRQNVRQTKEEAGRLVAREEAFSVAEEILRRVRVAVLGLPAAVLPDLEELGPEESAREVLVEWVAFFLEDMAEAAVSLEKQFPRAAREAVQALGCERVDAPVENRQPAPAPEVELLASYDPGADPYAVTIEAELVTPPGKESFGSV